MSKLKINWRRQGHEIIIYSGEKERRRDIAYRTMIDKDANKLAQVLFDLELVGNFPIEEAIKIYLRRRESKDWLGF